jgi:heat shock protein 4
MLHVISHCVWCQLYDKLQEYVTEHEREELSAKLQQTEDWLYEDGEDETKSVYVAKLGELKKVQYLVDR